NANPCIKPAGDICYSCYKFGHHSNTCPKRKQGNLVEPEAVDEEKDTEVEDEYEGAEYAVEEGAKMLNLVL
ncbi:zf-CCHC domain-containing, partial, partial [Olea europaea subsp. europaea]